MLDEEGNPVVDEEKALNEDNDEDDEVLQLVAAANAKKAKGGKRSRKKNSSKSLILHLVAGTAAKAPAARSKRINSGKRLIKISLKSSFATPPVQVRSRMQHRPAARRARVVSVLGRSFRRDYYLRRRYD